MKSEIRKSIRKYGIAIMVGAAFLTLSLSLNHFLEAETAAEKVRLLCDGFTIGGTVLVCAGAFVWLHNQGMFHGIGYALSYAVKGLIPGALATDVPERYGDYVERKNEKGPVKGYSFLFVVGGGFFAVAVILLIAFFLL